MRVGPLTTVAALSLGLASFAAACSESFPAYPAPAIDAGSAAGGPLEAQPPDIVPPESRANASSAPVAFDPVRGGVWTANGDVGTISYVDPAARKVVQEIPVGQDVRSIALSPDGVWIAAVDRDGAAVSLVDAASRSVRRTIALGIHPRACVWDAANPRWLYVTEEEDGAVVVIDRTLGVIDGTIAVGRRPAGLAVSASRRELYISHRIDAEVTIVDLHDRAVVRQVPLADEPFSTLAVPNGKPLGFESIALTAGGDYIWIPHELLAATHPIVFNETLFPAISVVDVADRVEQQTDPNSADIAGRKNLFDAIAIQGPNGQPDVFSQPCAVTMHPGGLWAWALMCGSEDLLTFSVGEGVATDALRGLPCDHPSGMTLDDVGARIFVLCDQSKQLVMLDTAGGDPAKHVTTIGAPIDVAVDTLGKKDPAMRAGLELFFEANSSKGSLASTGNNWMSCAGCHLDGFGSTNLRLFEALMPPPNEALDAQIGHVGLTDRFATAVPRPKQSLDPHDFLVALLDQGGLAPDRTGANRAKAVDPSNPVAAAVQMAQGLARVLARDLPAQPTWLQNAGPAPDATYLTYDGQWCGQCHQSEYDAWRQSVHSHAGADPMMLFGVSQEPGTLQPLCAGCHDPVMTRAGDTSLLQPHGVSCLGCHDVTGLTQGGGNADLIASTHEWTADHKEWGLASLELLKKPEFCGGCHRQFVPGSGLAALTTLDEFEQSAYSPSTRCVDCHMPRIGTSGVSNHLFAGGNVYMGQLIASERIDGGVGDAAVDPGSLLDLQKGNLEHVAQLSAQPVDGGVLVTVRNGGAGHWFPTGVTDVREPWVELCTTDGSGNVVDHIGGPTPATGNLLPDGAARMGIDIASADGTILLFHEVGRATSIPFDQRIPSGEALAFFIPVSLAGIKKVEASLYYRNVRTSYYRAATGDQNAVPPQTLMASATLVLP
jgi:hypothetical protein